MPRHRTASIRPSHTAIVRAPGLLPMNYTLRELSEELDIPIATLNDWRELGLPSERDTRGHVWIEGRAFAGWLNRIRPRRRRLAQHEVYCVHCQTATQMIRESTVSEHGVNRVNGRCAECGGKVTRGVRRRA